MFWGNYLGASAAQYSKLSIVTEHFPPYQELNENGKVVGFATELINAALAKTSIDYDINIYPWSRSYAKAIQDKNTCIYLIGRNKARENLFKWLQPIISTNDYFVALKNKENIAINSIDDVKKYKVAVLKDDRTHTLLLQHGFIENKNLYVVNNTYSLLKLLVLRPEIDFILADTVNVLYRAKFNNIDPSLFKTYFKINKKPIDLYFACSLQTDDEIIQAINKAITKIKKNGKYMEISHSWKMD